MSITLHYHPFSRASGAVWMLEEVGVPYALHFVDIQKGEQKSDAHRARNRMGKLPVLEDGECVMSETAAIGIYLADRYSLGKLAPALDDPRRGPYLRWAFYSPAVIEPGCAAHAAKWEFRPGSVGWGTWEEMLDTLDNGLSRGPYLLGEQFSMADVILGGTVRFMLRFNMLEPRPSFTQYVERISSRPAAKRADEINAKQTQAHGLA